jgi:hypothetical protein
VLFYLLAGVGAVLELGARRRDDERDASATPVPVRTTQAAREIA